MISSVRIELLNNAVPDLSPVRYRTVYGLLTDKEPFPVFATLSYETPRDKELRWKRDHLMLRYDQDHWIASRVAQAYIEYEGLDPNHDFATSIRSKLYLATDFGQLLDVKIVTEPERNYAGLEAKWTYITSTKEHSCRVFAK